jgi:hypothetical protein
LVAARAPAQIGIGGVADRTIYTSQVTFTVTNEAGYAYDARVDGTAVAVGSPVAVTNAEYHELFVWRTNTTSMAVTSRLVRFIVRAAERSNTEDGIPPWTPYPPIDSAPAEFASGNLRILAPMDYPQGMEIPVVAWVEDSTGRALRVNGAVAAPGQASFRLLRGVGSGFLSASNAPGPLDYAAAVGGLQTGVTIHIETDTVWTAVGGTLGGAIDWPAGSRISVTGDVYLASGATLTVGEGTVVRVGPGVDITNNAQIVIQGTRERPVVFAPISRNQPWGGFTMRTGEGSVKATGAIFTGSGADPSWFGSGGNPGSHRTEQALFFCAGTNSIELTDCAAIYLAGQLGHAVDGGTFKLTRFLMQRTTTGGEYSGGSRPLRFDVADSAFIECPYDSGQFVDGDNDALYIVHGQHSFVRTLFGFTKDDGIDCGGSGAGVLNLADCWFESIFHEGTSLSGNGKQVNHTGNVLLNCGQAVECGYDGPTGRVERCLVLANVTGVRFADNYNWTYNGFISASNSIVLHNHRDVWGMNWADWTYRGDRMSIVSNALSAPDALWPVNVVWNPGADASRLGDFLNQPAGGPVGVGIALRDHVLDVAGLAAGVPVRLSRFCSETVSVSCVAETESGTLVLSPLIFEPGETVKIAAMGALAVATDELVRVALREPVNAVVTAPADVYSLPPASTSRPPVVALISLDDEWLYDQSGIDLGSAWREPDFDDTSWPAGQGLLGVETTSPYPYPAPIRTPLNATGAAGQPITYYFRTTFVAPPDLTGFTLDAGIYLDDGAVFHLNGTNIGRIRLPAGSIVYTNLASNQGNEGTHETLAISADSLIPGATNLLAVEVHQSSPTSSDVMWGMTLDAVPPPLPPDLLVDRLSDAWVLYADDPAALETATDVEGPWQPEPDAPLPHAVVPDSDLLFFRLRAAGD